MFQSGRFFVEEIASRVDDDWERARSGRILDLFKEISAGHIGQAEVKNHAVVFVGLNRGEGVFAGGDNGGLHVAIADEFANAHGLNFVILDEQKVFDGAFDEIFDLIEGHFQRFFGFGLGQESKNRWKWPSIKSKISSN